MFNSAKEYKQFLDRVQALKKLGVPINKDVSMSVMHTMVSQGLLHRTYLNSTTKEELEKEVKEWASKNLLKKGDKDVPSWRPRDIDTGTDRGPKDTAA